jgi:hypothetical protein
MLLINEYFVVKKALEPLEAEAQAILLGTSLIDNQTLADSMLVGSPRTHHGHWSL